MAKRQGQDRREELENADDFSYEAFKKHCEKVPDYVEGLRKYFDAFAPTYKEGITYLTWRANNRFYFERVIKRLARLPNIKERLKYLYEIKAEFEQFSDSSGLPHLRDEIKSKKFARDCESEIEKLERLLALEQSGMERESKAGKEKRNRGGTQFQNLLAIHYLLKFAKANSHNTEKAKFASFLTGYSENTLRQQWSNIHRKGDDEGNQIWERDMKTVRDYFEALGLTGVVKIIDNDLASQTE